MKFPGGPAKGISAIVRALAVAGIDVIVVADGTSRPPTKRATVKRSASREHARISALMAKKELAMLLQSKHYTNDEKAALERRVKTKERAAAAALPPLDFTKDLKDELEFLSEDKDIQSTQIHLKIAKQQADPLIARLLIDRMGQAIMSSDSDFAAYLGSNCLCIKNFRYSFRESKLDKIVLSTGDSRMAEKVNAFMQNNFIVFKNKPKHPIFSGEDDPMSRALICVGLGCDVYPGGVAHFGPAKMHTAITGIAEAGCVSQNERFDKLCIVLSEAARKENKTIDITSHNAVLRTLTKALICEPCDAVGDPDDVVTYMYNKPDELEYYLRDFAPSDESVRIVAGPLVTNCPGYGKGAHSFLCAEGISACAKCNSNFCKFCVFPFMGLPTCLNCLRYETVGFDNSLTEANMRETLKNKHVRVPAEASYHEVMELYEMMLDGQEYCSLLALSVPFPCFPSIFFDGHAGTTHIILEGLDISDIPRIIRDDDVISLSHVCDIITLLSLLAVNYLVFDDQGNTNDKADTSVMELNVEGAIASTIDDRISLVASEDTAASMTDTSTETIMKDTVQTVKLGEQANYKYAIYSTMPELLVNFAKGCRIHNGLRLLKRAAHHAVDPMMSDFLSERLQIGLHDGSFYFDINGRVHASMKKHDYATRVAFSANQLLCCKCNCPSGSENGNRHACVHSLAKLYQLVLLLYEGLAENILIELRVRLLPELEVLHNYETRLQD